MDEAHNLKVEIDYFELGMEVRREIVKMLIASGRGHLGAAFSIVEILSVLFERVLRIDGRKPRNPDRDRFILSKGHGCLALYVFLARKGFFPKSELVKFCNPEGILGGHPDHRKVPGIEASTGSLGHGLSIGIGMAIAAKIDGRSYNTYVLVGDGECDEGAIWEAALAACKHRLENLTLLVDYNKMQSFGTTHEVLELEPFGDKFKAFGFETYEVDMDRPEELERILLASPGGAAKPRAIICHTIKGKGYGPAENNAAWHHKSKLTEVELRQLMETFKV